MRKLQGKRGYLHPSRVSMRLDFFRAFCVGAFLSVALVACITEDEILVDAPSVPSAPDGMPLFNDVVVEYSAAGTKWGAPGAMVYHLVTREDGAAEASITLGEPGTAVPHVKSVPAEAARVSVGRLYESMVKAQPDEARRGCAYPVRARMIRADGVMLERQDCRGGAEWTRVASLLVSELRD